MYCTVLALNPSQCAAAIKFCYSDSVFHEWSKVYAERQSTTFSSIAILACVMNPKETLASEVVDTYIRWCVEVDALAVQADCSFCSAILRWKTCHAQEGQTHTTVQTLENRQTISKIGRKQALL